MSTPVDHNAERIVERMAEQVRDAWVAWAKTQPDPKSSWLVPWADLNEVDRDADRAIARMFATALADALSEANESIDRNDFDGAVNRLRSRIEVLEEALWDTTDNLCWYGPAVLRRDHIAMEPRIASEDAVAAARALLSQTPDPQTGVSAPATEEVGGE